jgi:transcriptional regulator with GAF, ATPase, and Fis domain/predicted negative regulator of RcsB-dependent stress response
MKNKIINNRFEIVESIGKGGMGEVYKVKDKSNDSIIALKLFTGIKFSKKSLTQFEKEFLTLSKLVHPNLVKVYDFGITTDLSKDKKPLPFYTMEYLKGKTINQYFTRNVNYPLFYEAIAQIAESLSYIHNKGFIHNDIKSTNIMIEAPESADQNLTVKIMDFGLIERIVDIKEKSYGGTVSYTSPEKLEGEQADGRSDIYSLGVVMYEITSGRLPFIGKSPISIIEGHLKEKPLSPTSFNKDIPKSLAEIILKNLEKDPSKRYQNADSLLLALNRASGYRIKSREKEISRGYILSADFIGRDSEFTELKNGFEAAQKGESRFILISGEAGVGKSRLLKELRIHAQMNQIPFYSAECYENLLIPYGPIIDLLESIIRLREDKLKNLLIQCCPDLTKLLPSLSEKNYVEERKTASRSSSGEEASRMIPAVCRFMVEASVVEPFIIAIENINWCEESTANLLQNLMNKVEKQEGQKPSFLILATARTDEISERSAAWALIQNLRKQKHFEEMNLQGLELSEVSALLSSMTGGQSTPTTILSKIMDETHGNPLFIEEYMSLLSDEGFFIPGEKIKISEEDLKSITIPEKMIDLFNRKISSIDDPPLMLLRASSIAGGKAVDPETLTSISGKKWDYVIENLNGLVESNILEKSTQDGEGEAFIFKSISLRRMIYQGMDDEDKTQLHKDYATYLERRYHGKPLYYAELAHHFKEGELLGKAADYYSRAADHASEISANKEALSFYSAAIDLMSRLASPEAGLILCKLYEKRGKIHELMGNFAKAEEDYHWMLARAEKDRDETFIGKAHIDLGDISFSFSNYFGALKNYKQASEIFEEQSLERELAQCFNRIGKVHLKLGNFQESGRHFEQAYLLAKRINDTRIMIENLINNGLLAREMGRLKDSLKCFEEAEHLARKTEEINILATILEGIAIGLDIQGKHAEASEKFRAALEIVEQSGDILLEASVKTNFGSLYAKLGNYQQSLALFEEALKIYHRIGIREGLVPNLQNLAHLYLQQSQYQKALDTADESLIISKKIMKKDLIAISLNLIGKIHLKLGDLDHAEENLEEAQSIMRNLKSLKWLYPFLMDLGELNLLREDYEKAKKNFQESCFLARRMGDKKRESMGLIRLGEAHLKEKDFSKSTKAINKSIEIAEESKLRKELADASLLNARVEIEKPGGDLLKAEMDSSDALETYRELKDTEQLWQANHTLGKIFLRRGKPEEARELLRRTHRFLEGIRSMLPDQWKKTFLNDPRRREFYYEWEKLKGYQDKKAKAPKLEMEALGHAAELSLLRKRADSLTRLMEINKKINSTLYLRELLKTIITTAIDLTAAERGFLILLEDGKMQFEVAQSADGSAMKKPEYDISKSIAEKVIRDGTPLISIDAQEDERFLEYASVHELQLRSVIAMPLRSKGKIIGSIYLDSRLGKGVFTNDHIELLSLFSDQSGIAIENASLYDELENKRKDIERLNLELQKTVDYQKSEMDDMKEELIEKQSTLEIRYRYGNIVGMNPKIQAVFNIIDKVADSKIPVIIYGDSGTGKELIARALHYNSVRKKKRFFTVNCSALTETLLESELFGYKKGAFTGADKDRKGIFEIADGGTLLLDEIGDMSLNMQSKLLRTLQDGEILPVGGKDVIRVDVRIISATNKNLKDLLEKKAFREDLYFRLNVAKINLPPLRERKDDIPLLVEHFLSKLARDEKKQKKAIDGAALKLLVSYAWPGNVRELEHEMAKLATFCKENIITQKCIKKYSSFYDEARAELRDSERFGKEALDDLKAFLTLEDLEKKQILMALDKTDNNKSKSAQILGINRATLFRKLKKYGIEQ